MKKKKDNDVSKYKVLIKEMKEINVLKNKNLDKLRGGKKEEEVEERRNFISKS